MDLSNLSPEDISQLREALGVNSQGGLDAQGRSPVYGNRVLRDLRLQPSATDPRPMFVWSAESPREQEQVNSEFPKLMWTKDGTELTVKSAKQQAEKIAEGCVLNPPANAKPFDIVSEQFAALSEADKTFLIEQQVLAKRNRLEMLMAGLSDDELAQLGAMTEKKPKAKSA